MQVIFYYPPNSTAPGSNVPENTTFVGTVEVDLSEVEKYANIEHVNLGKIACDIAWREMQRGIGERADFYKIRSACVGDVFEVEGHCFLCCSTGWQEITQEEKDEWLGANLDWGYRLMVNCEGQYNFKELLKHTLTGGRKG
jgi:hypothetical protein